MTHRTDEQTGWCKHCLNDIKDDRSPIYLEGLCLKHSGGVKHTDESVVEFDARMFVKKARAQNWKNGGVLCHDDDELIEELESLLTSQSIKHKAEVEVEKVRKEERERILAIPVIKEFVESTPVWYEDIAPAFRNGKCIMCGRRIQKQKDLCDALLALTNKES